MSAEDLIAGLKRSGTGIPKLDRARRWLNENGGNAASLVAGMAAEALKAFPDDPWPAVTVEKASAILAGAYKWEGEGEALPHTPILKGQAVQLAIPGLKAPPEVTPAPVGIDASLPTLAKRR